MDTASLEDRKVEVLLRWWSSPVYTETTLRQKLDAVLGRENYILDIELDKKTGIMSGRSDAKVYDQGSRRSV